MWRLWPQVCLLAGALLAGGVCVSCTLNPMDTTELEAEALTSQIQPTAVTDLAATTTEKSTITFDFSGNPDEIAAGAYYTLYYLSGPDYSVTHTIPVVAQSVAGHYVFTLSDSERGKACACLGGYKHSGSIIEWSKRVDFLGRFRDCGRGDSSFRMA